jgi:HEPN domain.
LQLLIKLGIEVPRTHEIRKLLSIIYDKLKIDEVMIFMRENRKDLIILENVRGKSQYGIPSVSKDEAE